MKKHFTYILESVMLFIFILALSFLSYFFFTCLPSWTTVLSGPLFLVACGEAYTLFEKLRLFIPIVIVSALLVIFTFLSFLVFDLPLGLKFILCIQSVIAIGFSIHYRKELKNTYSGNFPIAYKRNCELVYNMCAVFISAFDGKHTDRILSSFNDFFKYDFEPFPEYAKSDTNIHFLMLRTLDHALIQLASRPGFYHSRKDNDSWHCSNDTLIGALFQIYKRVQHCLEEYEFQDFAEACRKWAALIVLVDNNYNENPPPVLSPEDDFHRRSAEAAERLFSQK